MAEVLVRYDTDGWITAWCDLSATGIDGDVIYEVDDRLTFEEIYFSVMHGEVIENYPSDNPYPSCLIMGRNFLGEPIPSV